VGAPAADLASLGEFRIDRILGEGGTSVVYAAHRAGEELALKVLRDDIDLTDNERKRFLAEADRLSRLSHPGVIRVLDAGVLPDGRPYLALPLLKGESLAARLSRGGMPIAKALEHFYAACDAITALHRAGLLHRDLKPENFFLEDDRIVLLDFGIARDPDATASTSTQQGQVRGTPAYMAPERFFGVAATEASEVYELAATLHVMLSGALPWQNGADLDARLDPKLSPAISPKIAAVLRGALAVRAEVRPQTVAQLVSALRDDTDGHVSQPTATLPNAAARQLARASSFIEATPTAKRRSRRKVAGIGAIIATAAIAAVAFGLVRHRAEKIVSDLVQRRTTVILLPKNLSERPDDAWLSTAIAERTRIGLEVGGSLDIVRGDALHQMSLDVSSSDGTAGQDLLKPVRERSGATILISSSYLAEVDHRLRVTFIAQETMSGAVIASANATGTVDDLGDVVSRAVRELRATLGDGPAAADHEKALVDSLPVGGEASRQYAEGLECERRFEHVCAKEHLERAVALAPNSALAHSALAEALHATGNDASAKVEAARSVELGKELPEEQRWLLDAHANAFAFAWPQAIESYTKLSQRYPEDLQYALGLADAQANAALPEAAYATLDRARKFSSDPRIDLVEAQTADKANDFAREAVAAERAIKAADRLGEQELGAYARLNKGWSSVILGKLDDAKAPLDEAVRMFGAQGDRNGTARAVTDIGTLLESKADFAGARKMYEDALRLSRELGNQSTIATILLDLGQVLSESGDTTSARARYEEALGIARQNSDVNLTEETLVNLGSLASKAGDIAGARKAYEESLKIATAHDHHRVIAAVLVNTSNLEEHAGNTSIAVDLARKAVAEARKTQEPVVMTQALVALADHLANAGLFDEGLKMFEEVEALQEKTNDVAGLANMRATRVGVLEDAGRDKDAEALATKTLETIDPRVDPSNWGWLKLELAKVNLEAKHYDVSAKLLAEAQLVLIDAGDAELTAEVEITGAELAAERGDLVHARATLAKVRAQHVADGSEALVREADIVAAELGVLYDHDPAAKVRLLALAKQARAVGAGAQARQAEEAAR
jgi:serine/threonine protein kinase/tetratricopeptide (TPR) repeat protein